MAVIPNGKNGEQRSLFVKYHWILVLMQSDSQDSKLESRMMQIPGESSVESPESLVT